MNLVLFRRTFGAQRLKLAVIAIALAAWGFILPVVYGAFGIDFRSLFESGVIPEQFASFGGGDVFSLAGSIALGFIHPITIILVGVFAVGFATASVAGERQRGTLEVLLARPISRRQLYVTLLIAAFVFLAVLLAAFLLGSLAGSAAAGVLDELDLAQVPVLWLNGVLLYGAFAAIGLLASVSFDRLTPAIGVTIALLVVMYFFQVLGSLWPDAAFLQPYSLFHYVAAKAVLVGNADAFDFTLLAVVIALAIVAALVVFPRRDLAAPS